MCAATRADIALFGLADVRPGAHINLVGSYRLDLREVSADLVAASTVAVDDVAAAQAEAGDLHLAVEEGVWSWDKIAGDLTDLATGRLRRTSTRRDHPVQERRSRRAGPGDRPTRCGSSRNPGGRVSKSVVIVGGGLVGLSSALFLTEAGADVTIIDNAALGSGAARGNAGFMCTAIVEPLPAPGAIGNALKSLRDPMRALRILPKSIPRMAPWLLTFARNCTASRYQSGRAALAEFNRNSAAILERLSNQGAAVTLSRELLVPYHDVAKAEHHFKALQPMVEFGARIPDRVVDGDELRRLAPAITDHVRAGLVMPGDRSIDPRRYVDSVIEILRSRET